MAKSIRIPFDSLTLSAVVAELRPYVGAKVQRITQPNETDLVFGLYLNGHEAYLLLSCDPEFARAHFITRRPGNPPVLPGFCAAVRSRLDGARLQDIRQIGFDRILELAFDGAEGQHRIIAELMGKHSNLILVDAGDKIVGAAKTVGASKSSRVIASGRHYERPPLPSRPSLLQAKFGDELKDLEGLSPFLKRWIEANSNGLEAVQNAVRGHSFSPVLSPGHGAYPLSVEALGLSSIGRQSISVALEQHFNLAIPEAKAEQLKSWLTAQLNRVILARETALNDLYQAREAVARADHYQVLGGLILSYIHQVAEGAGNLEAFDYEGNAITIALDPDKSAKENANAYFDKAKRAKARQGIVEDQITRIEQDKLEIESLLARVEAEDRLDRLQDFNEQARERRWLHNQPLPTAKKEDRPYEGHRIRELVGPEGTRIFYGENATSNDYLTLRIAKPDDWWLHIRGSASAHVVIETRKHPEKIGKEALMFAAKIAVKNSPSKHSGFVPVDYTLKKYVRKPRGAPAGTALYTHEKTLHVEDA